MIKNYFKIAILSLVLAVPAFAATQRITGRQIAVDTVTDNNIANGAVGTLELADNSILERDMSVINSPTDGFCLTYDSATLSFEWVTCVQNLERTAVADTNYTALATDNIIAYTSITVARTVTLPTAASAGSATSTHIYYIKDESGSVTGAKKIIVDGNGSETIDGQLSINIVVSYGILAIYSNGTSWFTL